MPLLLQAVRNTRRTERDRETIRWNKHTIALYSKIQCMQLHILYIYRISIIAHVRVHIRPTISIHNDVDAEFTEKQMFFFCARTGLVIFGMHSRNRFVPLESCVFAVLLLFYMSIHRTAVHAAFFLRFFIQFNFTAINTIPSDESPQISVTQTVSQYYYKCRGESRQILRLFAEDKIIWTSQHNEPPSRINFDGTRWSEMSEWLWNSLRTPASLDCK